MDCKKDCYCKKSFTIIRLRRGRWLIMLKFAKSAFVCIHQFFPRHLQFLIQSYTVHSLFESCHWSVKVALFCNLMGSLAVKITADELYLRSNGFLTKIIHPNWIIFTIGSVDRYVGRLSGRHSVETWSIVGRHSFDSRSIVSRDVCRPI